MGATETQNPSTSAELEEGKAEVVSEPVNFEMEMSNLPKWTTIAILNLCNRGFYVMHDFNSTSDSLATFTVSAYVLGYVFGPLVIAPVWGIYGRLWPLHFGTALFIVCLIACSFSNNLGMFLFFRVIMGFAGVDLVILGPAVVADLIPKERRALALSAMSIGPGVDPTLGPLVGGYIVEKLIWRWIFWIGTIVMVVCWIPAVFVLRETYPPILQARASRSKKVRGAASNNMTGPSVDGSSVLPCQETTEQYHATITMPAAEPISGKDIMKRAWIRPTKMLFRSPTVVLVAIYTALYNAYLQIYFATIGTVFQEQYGFSPGESGLAYLGMTVGMLFCQLTLGKWADQFQLWMEERHDGEERPEFRLPPLLVGAVTMPLGICLYAWTVQARAHWMVPIIGTAVIAVGVLWGYLPCLFYLLNVYPLYAASAMGGACIVGAAVSALLPLAANPTFDRLGFGWGNTLLALLTVAFVPLAVYLYKYGAELRKRSRYDPAL